MAKKVRSAKTGKYVDPDEAKTSPDTTVVESSKGKSKAKAPAKKGMKYYRSALAGLSFVLKVGDPLLADSIERVRFAPYLEKHEGDDVKVGYLATDNPEAHKRLEADVNVEEITKDEFVTYTEGGKVFGKPHVPKRVAL